MRMTLAGKKARKGARQDGEAVEDTTTLSASATAARHLQSLRRKSDVEPLAKDPPVKPKKEPTSKAGERQTPPAPKAKLTPQLERILREERLCMPVVSMLILFIDLSVCTGHLMLGFLEPTYRQDFISNHFWLMTVLWSIWNILSHPFWRDNTIDVFIVYPEELHTVLNMVAVLAFTFTQTVPSWRQRPHCATAVVDQKGSFEVSFIQSARIS
eukprot:s1935_g13.t1